MFSEICFTKHNTKHHPAEPLSVTIALDTLLDTVASRIIAASGELTDLDSTIGDADHGLNMKRGFEAVLAGMAVILIEPIAGLSVASAGATLMVATHSRIAVDLNRDPSGAELYAGADYLAFAPVYGNGTVPRPGVRRIRCSDASRSSALRTVTRATPNSCINAISPGRPALKRPCRTFRPRNQRRSSSSIVSIAFFDRATRGQESTATTRLLSAG